jgi:hypothetical protein
MCRSVITAFNEFLHDTVNLDAGQTTTARVSRDWLFRQINSFPDSEKSFPRLFAFVVRLTHQSGSSICPKIVLL